MGASMFAFIFEYIYIYIDRYIKIQHLYITSLYNIIFTYVPIHQIGLSHSLLLPPRVRPP